MTDILAVSPTRSELLTIKSKEKLAQKGHSLLKKKQDVLINEFFTKVKEYKAQKQDLVEKTKKAYKALILDIAYMGVAQSKSVSYATQRCFELGFTTENIMGVKLPVITAKKLEVDVHHYENSPQLAEATRLFQELFLDLITLASMKATIRGLADEIKKIKRRVNSLEHIQIPRLQATKKHILFVLDEQERENFTRLKLIKQRLEEDV